MKRRHEVAALYLQGEHQYAIGEALGVSQMQISLDLKAIRAAWLQSSIRDFDAAKAQELAKIDATEREYWQGWRRSQRHREVRLTQATKGGQEGPRHKTSLRKEAQVGDPRFLDGVLKCIAQRCDILGFSTAAEAAKELSHGLASLLVQAKQTMTSYALPPEPPAAMVEA